MKCCFSNICIVVPTRWVQGDRMKEAAVSLLALVLGLAAGWPWLGTETLEHIGVTSPDKLPAPSPERMAELEDRVTEVLGDGWRDWAERIEAAESHGELERLSAELVATGDQALGQTVGRLLAARWVEIDPAGGLQALWPDGTRWVLHPLLVEWLILDHEAAVASRSGSQRRAAPLASRESSACSWACSGPSLRQESRRRNGSMIDGSTSEEQEEPTGRPFHRATLPTSVARTPWFAGPVAELVVLAKQGKGIARWRDSVV